MSPMAELDAKGGAQPGGGQLAGIYHLSNCFYLPANSLYPRSWTKVPLVLFVEQTLSKRV